LHELIAAITEDAGFESMAEGKTLHFDNDADILLMGNAELLHRAFENVIRNAVRHTAAGTCVEIEARTEPGQVRVTVNDHGPGVKPSELELIFEPFYRGEQNGLSKGFGFGLSIARRAILAHGGTITAHNLRNGGLSIEITLALAPPKPLPSA
jgi:two-component system OmpR family sensor kinase